MRGQSSSASMESVPTVSESGQPQTKYDSLKVLEESVTIIPQTFTNSCTATLETQKPLKKRKRSSTQESLLQDSAETCSDSAMICDPNIPLTNSSATSPLVSTSSDAVLKPFWKKHTRELSAKLWLPTKTDSVVSPLTSSETCLKDRAVKSWFSVKRVIQPPMMKQNLQTTCWPSLMSSLQKETDSVQPQTASGGKSSSKKPKVEKEQKVQMKARKVRIYPNAEERATLRKWMGTARWTYNQCLSKTQEGVKKAKKELRAHCLNQDANLPQWVYETPYDVRDEAMNDLLKAYDVCFSKGDKFTMKFRSKRDKTQSIAILKKHWGNKSGFWAFLPKIKAAESIPKDLHCDSRLLLDDLKRWWLCLPEPLTVAQRVGDTQTTLRVASIDPGVRTFATIYSAGADGAAVTEFGVNDYGRIYNLCRHADNLQSRWSSSCTSRKRRRLKMAAKRISSKVRNIVDDLHRKLAAFLVDAHDVILLPKFETQGMVQKKNRRISSKTARAMCTWSHYRFRCHLLQKARCRPEVSVKLVTEEFTSKTCGNCGELHQKLGSSKTFKCPSCKTIVDRDYNGARNILLKFLTEKTAPTAHAVGSG